MNTNLHIDNQSLVEECMKGNQEALNLFYTRFAPSMLRVIRRYVVTEKDSEDILHDGFIVAFTRLSSLRNTERVDYWLASIMKNLSLQFLHNQDIVTILHELPEVEEPPQLEEIIDIETLESLIGRLPDGYQKVFRLAVLENKSHKEIGKILGIAPNSSSSQLFHAKVMMRRLIMEHRKKAGLLSAALLLALGGYVAFENLPDSGLDQYATLDDMDMELLIREPQDNVEPLNRLPNIAMSSSSGYKSLPEKIFAEKTDAEEITGSEAQENAFAGEEEKVGQKEVISAEILNEAAEKTEEIDKEPLVVDSRPVSSSPTSMLLPDPIRHDSGWSMTIGVNTGITAMSNPEAEKSGMSALPGGWDSTLGDPDDGNKDNDEPKTRSSAPRRDYSGISHQNYQPIAFSVTAHKSFSKILGLETGLTYTYLHSKYEYMGSALHCHWHYLGVPLKLTVNTYSNSTISLYASVGGEIDFPVATNSTLTGQPSSILQTGRFSAPVEGSLSVGYGINFKLSRNVGVFVEPTLQYHFNSNPGVPNIWSDNSWVFSLPIGFRFNF